MHYYGPITPEYTFEINDTTLSSIITTIGHRPAESGGALGGPERQGRVTHYYFDTESRRTSNRYTTDHSTLNHVFKDEWNPNGIHLIGFVHSHPGGLPHPSAGDCAYAQRILAANPELRWLWLPIVTTIPDTGRFRLTPFAAVWANGSAKLVKASVAVVEDSGQGIAVPNGIVIPRSCLNQPRDELVFSVEPDSGQLEELLHIEPLDDEGITGLNLMATVPQRSQVREVPDAASNDPIPHSEAFSRVRNAYDLELLQRTTFVYCGGGGARGFIEQNVRTGVKRHIAIDPDVVSESNLATQQVFRSEIGRPKVECIKERILDINPDASVRAFQRRIEDFSDQEFEDIITARDSGGAAGPIILCGFSDSFPAQARVNRLALHFGLPSMAAQVYQDGRGAEITFTHPDTTRACHRCVLGGRYRAFLEENYQNTVTSHGAPIFATDRVNALKGFIAMGLVHYGTDHPRWNQLIERIGSRNLIQIRLDPDIHDSLGLTVFERVFAGADTQRVLFDETVFLPQEPENPSTGFTACPDCGGTGNLRDAIGTFDDTRPMRK